MISETFQSGFQLCISDYKRKGSFFQNRADSLLLGKDQASLWRCLVNGNHKENKIFRGNQIRDQWIFMRFFRFQGSKHFFQLMDAPASFCAYIDFICFSGFRGSRRSAFAGSSKSVRITFDRISSGKSFRFRSKICLIINQDPGIFFPENGGSVLPRTGFYLYECLLPEQQYLFYLKPESFFLHGELQVLLHRQCPGYQ